MPYEGHHMIFMTASRDAQTGSATASPVGSWDVLALSRLRFAYSAIATLLVALLLGLAGLTFATFTVVRAVLKAGFSSTR